MRDLALLLSPAGWPYASASPQARGDPGRFHALFGRDALILSLQLLPARPDVACATLRALASLQGERDDRQTGEQPGKIVHEYRFPAPRLFAARGWPVRQGRLRYYGSTDATAWFVIVMAALDQPELTSELERSWRAAGGWLEQALQRGNGLVCHEPTTARGGLTQQGWRDTDDPLAADGGGILHADGTVPDSQLADVDTQAAALAALRALARLAGTGPARSPVAPTDHQDTRRAVGPEAPEDGTEQERYSELATRLAATIRARLGPETMAIEPSGRAVKGAGSQLGWLLWAGADLPGLASRLCAPDVLTAWGLRTLSSEHPQFRPTAYHRGAVWPFDSWIGWGGLRAAGRYAEAEQVRAGVLDALDRLGGAPELYAVTTQGPEAIPISNHVQAWTIGARWALDHEWDAREAIGLESTERLS